MTRKILIKNAKLVNEGRVFPSDVRICNDRIETIAGSITSSEGEDVVDASRFYLLPGMIDDQVHFRDPGKVLTGSVSLSFSLSNELGT